MPYKAVKIRTFKGNVKREIQWAENFSDIRSADSIFSALSLFFLRFSSLFQYQILKTTPPAVGSSYSFL